MSDRAQEKKSLSKTRKLVPNVIARHRHGIKKETKRPKSSQKTNAAFEEIMEAAKKDATWERGGRSVRHASYKATSNVVFGAHASAPKLSHQGQVWGGEKNIKPEVKSKKQEMEIDHEGLYPTLLPFRQPGENERVSQDHVHKLLPRYIEDRLAEVDSEEEDTSAAKELHLDSGPPSNPVIFQLPSILPSFTSSKGEEKEATISRSLTELPEGRIGKLVVYKSGKVCLRLGEVLLDISSGTPNQLYQQLVAINVGDDNGHCVFLGDIQKRAICTFNMYQLLSPKEHNDHLQMAQKEVKLGEQVNVDVKEEKMEVDCGELEKIPDSCVMVDPMIIKQEDIVSYTGS